MKCTEKWTKTAQGWLECILTNLEVDANLSNQSQHYPGFELEA